MRTRRSLRDERDGKRHQRNGTRFAAPPFDENMIARHIFGQYKTNRAGRETARPWSAQTSRRFPGGRDRNKIVAAEMRDKRAVGGQSFDHELREIAEHLIAGAVSIQLIVGTKMVNVGVNNRGGLILGKARVDLAMQVGCGGQFGQGVELIAAAQKRFDIRDEFFGVERFAHNPVRAALQTLNFDFGAAVARKNEHGNVIGKGVAFQDDGQHPDPSRSGI